MTKAHNARGGPRTSKRHAPAISSPRHSRGAVAQDEDPYVRKTAVMSCLKLHTYSPDALKDSDIVNTLYTMLRDRDPQARRAP